VADRAGGCLIFALSPSAIGISTASKAFRQSDLRNADRNQRPEPYDCPQPGKLCACHLIICERGMGCLPIDPCNTVIDIDIGDVAHWDVDTPEAVVAAGGVLKG